MAIWRLAAGLAHRSLTLRNWFELLPAQKLPPAQKLLGWLQHEWTKDTVSARDIYTFGPRSIRDRQSATDLAGILVKHGWLIPIKTRQNNMEKWAIVRKPST